MKRRRGRKKHAELDFTGLEPAPPSITFIADEMLNESSVAVMTEAKAKVLFANRIAAGWEDSEVAKLADIHQGIVVTLNVKDFNRLMAKRTDANQTRFRHASLLAILCDPTRVSARLRTTWDFIVGEWVSAQRRSDKRIFVEISEDWARTYR